MEYDIWNKMKQKRVWAAALDDMLEVWDTFHFVLCRVRKNSICYVSVRPSVLIQTTADYKYQQGILHSKYWCASLSKDLVITGGASKRMN